MNMQHGLGHRALTCLCAFLLQTNILVQNAWGTQLSVTEALANTAFHNDKLQLFVGGNTVVPV
jgi:hypothetical protein